MKNTQKIIHPYSYNPILKIEERSYKGYFEVKFICYNIGKAEVKISLSMKVENDENIDFSIYFLKECSIIFEDLYMYMVLLL